MKESTITAPALEPEREITFKGYGFWMSRSPLPSAKPRRYMKRPVIFRYGIADLIIHDVPPFEPGGDPDPEREIGTIRLDAAQFGRLVQCALAPDDPDLAF